MSIKNLTYFVIGMIFPLIQIGCLNTPRSRDNVFLKKGKDPSDFVNPMIGASTSIRDAGTYHGLGKTFPGATTPYGMVQVSPNTITGGDNGSGYSSEHTSIEGFAHTQMSGVGWFGDLGNFLVMPTIGDLKTNSGALDYPDSGYRSRYDKKSEEASAGYYKVHLTDYDITAEATATPHSGMLRFTFPKNEKSRIQIDLARRVGGTCTRQNIKVLDSVTIQGWMKCTPKGGGWGNGEGKADYTVHFYSQFSKPFKKHGVWSVKIPAEWSRLRESVTSEKYQRLIANAHVLKGKSAYEGDHIGFFAQFSTRENEKIVMKTGISFVDIEGAKKNLIAEIKGFDFDSTYGKARKAWNRSLSRIKVKGSTKDARTIFYTALYHTQIDPRIFGDVDGRYIGGDHKIHFSKNFTKRTIFSGWDVFRSQMPLQTLIDPSLINDMISSLITLAQETNRNYFPRWEFLNSYSGVMIGNPAVSMLSDAYSKKIRGYDIDKAYELAKGSVEKFGNAPLGYSPGNLGISKTLEYAYADWCVSTMAEQLGNKEDSKKYYRRSKNYKNIFDPQKKWFRPKDHLGNWLPWPRDGRLEQDFGTIESNPYQQGWFVPHDIPGMINLMGGTEEARKDLENFFEQTPKDMKWNNYYNHPNEPVHHIVFLFNRMEVPWLTQKWSRQIADWAYGNSVDGLVGNEDVGQMSAWYVLASMGIHPISPGETSYEITSPVFDEIIINADTNHPFTIRAKNNSPENIYIQHAKLNHKNYNKSNIDYRDIISGGELVLEMGNTPNKQWGLKK